MRQPYLLLTMHNQSASVVFCLLHLARKPTAPWCTDVLACLKFACLRTRFHNLAAKHHNHIIGNIRHHAKIVRNKQHRHIHARFQLI